MFGWHGNYCLYLNLIIGMNGMCPCLCLEACVPLLLFIHELERWVHYATDSDSNESLQLANRSLRYVTWSTTQIQFTNLLSSSYFQFINSSSQSSIDIKSKSGQTLELLANSVALILTSVNPLLWRTSSYRELNISHINNKPQPSIEKHEMASRLLNSSQTDLQTIHNSIYNYGYIELLLYSYVIAINLWSV